MDGLLWLSLALQALQATPRMQGPGCSLLRPLLRVMLAATLRKTPRLPRDREQSCLLLIIKQQIPQDQYSLAVIQPPACAGIHPDPGYHMGHWGQGELMPTY